MKDGTPIFLTVFRASDGVKLTASFAHLDSPSRAREELGAVLGDVTRVLRRGPKLDSAGRRVGERAEAEFTEAGTHATLFLVIWTHGPSLDEVSSSSLADSRELERQLSTAEK
jgi:hypothetical protein